MGAVEERLKNLQKLKRVLKLVDPMQKLKVGERMEDRISRLEEIFENQAVNYEREFQKKNQEKSRMHERSRYGIFNQDNQGQKAL